MPASTISTRSDRTLFDRTILSRGSALTYAARSWFLTTVCGQMAFAAYIAALYIKAAMAGDWASWNKIMPNGLIAGDGAGNAALVAHLLLAFLVTALGAAQFSATIRRRLPSLHRWNGRMYLTAAGSAALTGIFMTWHRLDPSEGLLFNAIGITLNALAILGCGAMTLRCALRRDFAAHRRWALRLFLVANGVFFVRIGMMFWILVNGGPVGLGDSLSGPAGLAISYFAFFGPICIAELYLRAEGSTNPALRCATAGLIAVITLAMAAGIVMAALFMWWPRI